MSQEHPITPPPELVQQWAQYKGFVSPEALWRFIATEAARWGADQELEACCEWIPKATPWDADQLRAARRPKPPSLKQQALAVLMNADGADHPIPVLVLPGDEVDTIRRALEALPDE